MDPVHPQFILDRDLGDSFVNHIGYIGGDWVVLGLYAHAPQRDGAADLTDDRAVGFDRIRA